MRCILFVIFVLSTIMAHGQSNLPKTKEVPGVVPGLTVTLYLDPATGNYVEKRYLRKKYANNVNKDTRPKTTSKYKAKYQGEVNALLVFGAGSNKYDRSGIEVVNGVRFNPYIFCGIGIGLNWYRLTNIGDMEDYVEVVGIQYAPIFLATKIYFSKKRIAPFFKADIGYGIGKSGRLYACPAVGIKFSIGQTMALNIDGGFQVQQISSYGSSDAMCGGLLRVGWSF